MISEIKNTFKSDSKYRPFLACLITSGLFFGVYKGILDNYLAEVVGMGEFDRGLTEFFRELPGLMLVVVLVIFYSFSAERLYKLGALLMLLGMAFFALAPAIKWMVIAALCISSLGEHIQLGMRNTLTLVYSKEGKSGEALGYQNAMYQVGNLLGFLVIVIAFYFFGEHKPYRPFFWVCVVITALTFLMSQRLTGKSETDKTNNRFYFRKKFTKYYMLEVFYGARKQVFFTFGPYVLILFYGANAMIISLLFAISAVLSFVLSPYIGKLIDKVGYKIIMISDTLILVIVCFFYGFAHHIFPMNIAFIVCCVNYILDSVISLASMASNVYVQDISDSKEEMKSTISTGISVNHLITIFVALFGGLVWEKLGIETLFIISALLGLCNSAYAASIKTNKKALQGN